jgi:hypothetical protein
MIGVIFRPEEKAAVEEFFELFKTPWEPFRQGRPYDVLLVASGAVPDVGARFLIIFGSSARDDDKQIGAEAGSKQGNLTLEHAGQLFPVYGDVLTFDETSQERVCVRSRYGPVGLKFDSAARTVLRIGYDLFQEIDFLLSVGQPVENAHIPAVEMHIGVLRSWMIDAGITFLEIPPAPAGYGFAVCLTHDIDFLGIRRHKFDHTMAGFLYRATVGAFLEFIQGRQSLSRLLRNWASAATLPFVYMGWAKDFWLQFDAYMEIERGLSATYYFIPFKKRPGEKVDAKNPERRAAAYDIGDVPALVEKLKQEGCEIGVHGIDAWHDVDMGREEFQRIAAATGQTAVGIRMHWLLNDRDSMRILEEAGYAYDSTLGYNETIGYRSGTSQVFRPPGRARLLELSMNIQDGALFYKQRLDLSEAEAWDRCETLLQNAAKFGGALTVLWHDRSLGPERFWGDFYIRLVRRLRTMDVWFANALQVVHWFRQRRGISFQRQPATAGFCDIELHHDGDKIAPPLVVRVHRPGKAPEDKAWTGESSLHFQECVTQERSCFSGQVISVVR